MEKKTIGSFIAALRRANGMTQKELAERLNVSDKTVSRWECNDGAPDLSVIPAIAEIFGVTCDELLRGEKAASSEMQEEQTTPLLSHKAEKQRQWLLARQLTRYRSATWISMGIALGGLIAAMIANLGFLRAYIGFFLGTVFYIASAISQALWINHAFLIGSADAADDPDIGHYHHQIIRHAEISFGLTFVLFGSTIPLLMAKDAYRGLGADSWLLYGMLLGALFLLIFCSFCFFLNFSLLIKGIYTLTEKEAARYHHNRRWKKISTAVLLATMAVTLLIHVVTTEIWGPRSIMKGTAFYDYESFIDYMEQDIPYQSPYNPYGSTSVAIPPSAEHDAIAYYDEFGNEITEEEALREVLTDHDGNILCEYVARNQSVCSVRYSVNEDGPQLPITVSTYDDLASARRLVAIRHGLFGVAYCAEILFILIVYFKKRIK